MPDAIKTRATPVISSVSTEPIFTVVPDVPFPRAIEEAGDLLDQVAGTIAGLAASLYGIDGEQARAAGSLLNSARAILESIEVSIEQQARDRQKPDQLAGEAA